MYVFRDGKKFVHAAPAVLYAFSKNPELEGYYQDYAPQTMTWLKWLQSSGEINRDTRFDRFLVAILARAGCIIDTCESGVLPVRPDDAARSLDGEPLHKQPYPYRTPRPRHPRT